MTHEVARFRNLLEEHREGMRLLTLNRDAARAITQGDTTPLAIVFSLPYLLFTADHGLIATPETSRNPDYVIKLQPNENPSDFGLEHSHVYVTAKGRFVIDTRERFENTDPESIFWLTLFNAILEPGKEYLVRGSCISTLFQDEPTLEHLPFLLKPLHDNHNWKDELTDSNDPVLQYLRQFADFKPNIDIYIDPEVIDRLLKLPIILGGSIEKITLDNGVVGYRVNYDGGYVNNQGVNLVVKPPSNDRRLPISNRSSHATGKVKAEEDGKIHVYVSKEHVLALNDHESIDFDALQALPAAEQLLQIGRFLRFNVLHRPGNTENESEILPLELVSRLKETLATINQEDLAHMPIDVSAAIGSEFLVAFLRNPQVVIDFISEMPDLFPYLNRGVMQNKRVQEGVITSFTRCSLDWRNPRSSPDVDLDLSPHIQTLSNHLALEDVLASVDSRCTYEPESDIWLTWGISSHRDIINLALLFCPIELTGQAKAHRETVYEPDFNDRQFFTAMTNRFNAPQDYYARYLRGESIDFEELRWRRAR